MDVYERLAQFLETLPAGFPRTEEGREMELLRRLFTPEEAALAQSLLLIPETAAGIAHRLKRPAEEVAAMLENMALKGLIYSRHRADGPPQYVATQFAVGFFEFQVGRMDREMAEDTLAYMSQVPPSFWENMPQLRTIPVGESIPHNATVMQYEQAEHIVRSYNKIRVNPCICRKQKQLLGEGCDKPLDSCLSFGSGAYFYERLGVGRDIDQEEALEILAQAEEAGLVLQPGNSRHPGSICCCCGDCCEVLAIAKRHPRPAEILASPFRAVVDEELCSACGDCEFRCQMEAIGVDNGWAVVDRDRCIGCGLCVTTCTEEAVTLVRKPESEQPPVPRNLALHYVDTLRKQGKASAGDLVRQVARSQVDRVMSRFS